MGVGLLFGIHLNIFLLFHFAASVLLPALVFTKILLTWFATRLLADMLRIGYFLVHLAADDELEDFHISHR